MCDEDGFEQAVWRPASAYNRSKSGVRRAWLFAKRRLKVSRFFLVVDLHKGVSIAASCLIVVDLIDVLWHLSMTLGPLSATLSSLLLAETGLVVCCSLALLYALAKSSKLQRINLRATLFAWLIVFAVDYLLRATMIALSLLISERASLSAKLIRLVEATLALALLAHCWMCGFSYFDELNDKTTTVKITPSDTLSAGRRTNLSHGSAGTSGGGKSILARALSAGAAHNSIINNSSAGGGGGGSGNASALAKASANAGAAIGAPHSTIPVANMLRAPTNDDVGLSNRW